MSQTQVGDPPASEASVDTQARPQSTTPWRLAGRERAAEGEAAGQPPIPALPSEWSADSGVIPTWLQILAWPLTGSVALGKWPDHL